MDQIFFMCLHLMGVNLENVVASEEGLDGFGPLFSEVFDLIGEILRDSLSGGIRLHPGNLAPRTFLQWSLLKEIDSHGLRLTEGPQICHALLTLYQEGLFEHCRITQTVCSSSGSE
jgi:hypothetical protein